MSVLDKPLDGNSSPGSGGAVDSVTGNIVNNTDPTNPIVTQVQSDWNASSGLGEILNKPTIAAAFVKVAVAGQNDLNASTSTTLNVAAGSNITLDTSITTNTLTINAANTDTPGGSATQVQYNNAGSFGGISGATSDGTTMTLTTPVLNGEATGTGVASTSTPSTLAMRDAGGNIIFNNITADGAMSSGINGGVGGQLTLSGATSGTLTTKVAAAAGTATVFQYPATNGTNGQVLKTDGTGITSWQNDSVTNDIVTATISSTYTINAASGNEFALTIGGSCVLSISSPPTSPIWNEIYVNFIGATGQEAASITFGTGFSFEGGSIPVIAKDDGEITTLKLIGPDPVNNDWRVTVLENNVKTANNQTGTSYTFKASDHKRSVSANNSSASTYTLPQQSTSPLPKGYKTFLFNQGAGAVTLAKQGSDVILGGNTLLQTSASSIITLQDVISGVNYWALEGGTATGSNVIPFNRAAVAADTTYPILLNSNIAFNIDSISQYAGAVTTGTFTVSIGATAGSAVNVGGLTTVTIASSLTTTSATSANAVQIGDSVFITFASVAGVTDFSSGLRVTGNYNT